MENNNKNNVTEFLRSYFEQLPIQPEWIENQFKKLSEFKKDLCDIYYYIMKKDSSNFNKFFYNIFAYDDYLDSNTKHKNSFQVPLISIWHNKLINLLWNINKKPINLNIVTYDVNKSNLLIKYINNLDLKILDESFFESITIPLKVKGNIVFPIFANPVVLNYNNSFDELFRLNDNAGDVVIFLLQDRKYFSEKEKSIIQAISKNNYIYLIYITKSKEYFLENLPNTFSDFDKDNKIKRYYVHLDDNFLEIAFDEVIPFGNNDIKFFDDLLTLNTIDLNKTRNDEIFAEFSNILKDYADSLISNPEDASESFFFLLESLRFSKKAIELKIDYAKELEKKAEWEKVIDELAHSLNTNLGAARDSVNSIYLESKDNNILSFLNDAENFLRESAEIVDLTLDSLKVDISIDDLSKVSLSEIIQTQIITIKKGINTLRFSTKQHRDNIRNLNTELQLDESIIFETYATAANLVIKDLLKNAFINTNHNSPFVSISSKLTNNKQCLLSITNNRSIAKAWADWINYDTEVEEIRMSKSRRVGMRVVKRWKPKLKWQIFASCDEKNDLTTITVTIPLLWEETK